MRVLIAAVGSHGDVLPFIGLAKAFQARGHAVRLYTNPYFEAVVRGAGIDLAPVATVAELESFLADPDLLHSLRGMRLIGKGLAEALPELYAAMERDAQPANTITIGSTLAFAPRLLREKRGIPTATIHLAPAVFRSSRHIPRLTAGASWQSAPPWMKRLMWAAADALFLDRVIAAPLNRFRASLGLPPIGRVFDRWLHEGELVVGMFPDWFAPPQPDWPANLELTGFPLYDHGEYHPLSDTLQAFIDGGEPPIAFTAGTATSAAPHFFAAAADACRLLGKRGILLSGYIGHLPRQLPAGVIHADYAPFSMLLPQVAAFAHHGGIGSTSQALRAGVPQLIRPAAYDQFDNADRAVRLGVARELLPRQFKPKAVAAALDQLMVDREIRTRCADAAKRFTGADAIADTCDLVLRRLGGHVAGRRAGAVS